MKQAVRFSAYLLVIILLPLIYYAPAIIPQPKTNIIRYTPPLGNILSSLFYYRYTNFVDQQQVDFYKTAFHNMQTSEIKTFFQNLAWDQQPKHNLITDYITKDDATWSSLDRTGNNKPNYLQYWQTLRPIMHDFYAKTFSAVAISNPVVHFRCSDSPLNRNIQYHLTKAASVKWMAEKIKSRGYSEVILLNCNNHHAADNNSCAQYTKFYAKLFTEYGLQVTKQCNSVLHDFALMLHSPLLVSLNASSFSFMAGVAKDPHDYISCNMGIEINGKYHLQTAADWILDGDAPLLHQEVEDYTNIKQVSSKLYSGR